MKILLSMMISFEMGMFLGPKKNVIIVSLKPLKSCLLISPTLFAFNIYNTLLYATELGLVKKVLDHELNTRL